MHRTCDITSEKRISRVKDMALPPWCCPCWPSFTMGMQHFRLQCTLMTAWDNATKAWSWAQLSSWLIKQTTRKKCTDNHRGTKNSRGLEKLLFVLSLIAHQQMCWLWRYFSTQEAANVTSLICLLCVVILLRWSQWRNSSEGVSQINE